MRNLIFIYCLLIFASCKSAQESNSSNIRINQVGYYPIANKVAIVACSKEARFRVINQLDKSVVFNGTLSSSINYKPSEENVRTADFTALDTEGTYKLEVDGVGESDAFEISRTTLKPAAIASLRTFYYQRCSYELKSDFAGIYSRAAGHPDTACTFHPSTGKAGKLFSPGGWYDAGDYGKYVVNAGISVGTLLSFYENFSTYFPDKSTLIPESGNGKNDLLDEVKVELDWLKTMQDADGGVFFKLTSNGFCGMVMPDKDNDERFVIGKSTTSTLDFAAVMAMAGRIYANYDSKFAAQCLVDAEKAWSWAEKNPSILFLNPKGITTGQYEDDSTVDEFNWAATELFISSNKEVYKTFLLKNAANLTYTAIPEWANVRGMAALSLATKASNFDNNIQNTIKQSIIAFADKQLAEVNTSGYRVPNIRFNWGSNSNVANQGVNLVYAWRLTNDLKYIKGASEVADYLIGKNPLAKSYLSGFGSAPVMNPHHRPSAADSIANPIPGFLAGGPNEGKQDGIALYIYHQPARSYADVIPSYASNEVAINWNSPLTALLAGIDYAMGGNLPIVFSVPGEKKDNLNKHLTVCNQHD